MSVSTAWILMFAGFFASAASQIIIKARIDPVTAAGSSYRQLISDPGVWLAILLIIIFVGCWYAALTKLQLSLMMAWSAIVLPLIALGSWMWLGETLSVGKLASIAVIALGIAGLSIF